MKRNNKGILIVLSGPSGAGKGTILEEYLKRDAGTVCSISATTRSPRPGEINGVHYHFVSQPDFEEMIAQGEIIEYAQYNGNYYGSPAKPIRDELEAGHNVILEIEVQGAQQVRTLFPDALSIFVIPPTFEELRRRLSGRGTESQEQITARLQTARQEVALATEYDYIIVNDVVEEAVDRLGYIIQAARCGQKFNESLIQEILTQV